MNHTHTHTQMETNTHTYTHMETNIHTHTHTQNLKTHIHREKITISEIQNHCNTHTLYQISKANEG